MDKIDANLDFLRTRGNQHFGNHELAPATHSRRFAFRARISGEADAQAGSEHMALKAFSPRPFR